MVACSTNLDMVVKFGIDPENMFPFWDWVSDGHSQFIANNNQNELWKRSVEDIPCVLPLERCLFPYNMALMYLNVSYKERIAWMITFDMLHWNATCLYY